ncbi:hypothetical protein DyAD56_16315 [Dyella sp. AD56]|uniref:hypothetical protein n=1 Tax=Dyella sp. AD56 TaxID=1528744 RepID=UPI000C81EF19|nr:hypothetical protein [Dyella sp. AD56]PMQ04253.1 hypothetical protein DyAD56_16315 [Dyella sp. AD56]
MSATPDTKLDLIWRMNERIKELNSLMAQFNAMCAPEYAIVRHYPNANDLLRLLFDSLDESEAHILGERMLAWRREQTTGAQVTA